MGMISEAEAWHRGVCTFCEQPVPDKNETIYKAEKLCTDCWKAYLDFDGTVRTFKDQLGEQTTFKLEDKAPIPIVMPGAVNMGWLILHEARLLIGSRISVEDYGLTAKFTIIPPTWEAGKKITDALLGERDVRDKNLRRGNKGNAGARHPL